MSRFARSHALVSKDRLRSHRRPARRQRELIEQALGRAASVVVDNTNPSRDERSELIRLGRSFGVEVVGYFFRSDVRSSLTRNELRTGRQRVPAVAIYAAARRLIHPELTEGFDALYDVELTTGGFSVDPRPGL